MQSGQFISLPKSELETSKGRKQLPMVPGAEPSTPHDTILRRRTIHTSQRYFGMCYRSVMQQKHSLCPRGR